MAKKIIGQFTAYAQNVDIFRIGYHMESLKLLKDQKTGEVDKFRLVTLEVDETQEILIGAVAVDKAGQVFDSQGHLAVLPCPPYCGKDPKKEKKYCVKKIGTQVKILATTGPFIGDFSFVEVDEMMRATIVPTDENHRYCQLYSVQLAPNYNLTGLVAAFQDNESIDIIRGISDLKNEIILPL